MFRCDHHHQAAKCGYSHTMQVTTLRCLMMVITQKNVGAVLMQIVIFFKAILLRNSW